jgi:hypothetical protein
MPLSQLDPYWQTRDEATVRLYQGDAMEVLERLPSQSIHCAVTSPPYWGLRKYLTDDNRELGLESHPDLYVSLEILILGEGRVGETYPNGKARLVTGKRVTWR